VSWLTSEIDLNILTQQITRARNHNGEAGKEGLPMGVYGAESSS